MLEATPADLTPRIGVADAKFPAFVAARMGEPGISNAPEDVRGFLAPYSVELLPVDADVKSKLHRFSLHRMGDVAAMEEHLLAAQFGREGSRLWAQNGQTGSSAQRAFSRYSMQDSCVENC